MAAKAAEIFGDSNNAEFGSNSNVKFGGGNASELGKTGIKAT